MMREAKKGRPAIASTLARCLILRCPVCGGSSIVRSPFQIKHHCSSCGALFKREDGFFVGAIMVNVMITEFVILTVYLISLPLFSFDDKLVIKLLIGLALVFPLAFYHHSWSIWLGFDHLVETLPVYAEPDSGQRQSDGQSKPRP